MLRQICAFLTCIAKSFDSVANDFKISLFCACYVWWSMLDFLLFGLRDPNNGGSSFVKPRNPDDEIDTYT